MSHCSNCQTKFTFMDMLKATNPAKVKCSGCDQHIESKYAVLGIAVVIFAALTAAFWFSPYSGDRLTGLPMLIFLGVLGMSFEFGYFVILDKGLIKSNLSR